MRSFAAPSAELKAVQLEAAQEAVRTAVIR